MKTIGKRSLASAISAVLTMTWFLLLVVLAVGVLLVVVSPFVDPPSINVGLEFPVAVRATSEVRPVADGAIGLSLSDLTGTMRFSPRARGVVAVTGVIIVFTLAVALWGLGELRALFRTLRAGTPFVSANARRLRHVAYALLFCEVGKAGLTYWTSYYTMQHFAVDGLRFQSRFDLDAAWLLSAAIVLVIAEVFREGARLDEEQSLTV